MIQGGSLVRRWPVLGRINELRCRASVPKSHGSLLLGTVRTAFQLVDTVENGPTVHEAPSIVLKFRSFSSNRKIERRGSYLPYPVKNRNPGASARAVTSRVMLCWSCRNQRTRGGGSRPRDVSSTCLGHSRRSPGAATLVRRKVHRDSGTTRS